MPMEYSDQYKVKINWQSYNIALKYVVKKNLQRQCTEFQSNLRIKFAEYFKAMKKEIDHIKAL